MCNTCVEVMFAVASLTHQLACGAYLCELVTVSGLKVALNVCHELVKTA